MTRKHFAALAAALAEARNASIALASTSEERAAINAHHERAVREVSRALAATNPRFDAGRFASAAEAL